MKRLLLCLLGVCCSALGGIGALPASSARAADTPLPDRPTFEAHIRPLLKAHCWHCHGEAERVEGSLDLRQARRLLKGGDTGPGAVAGQPGDSLLLERVESGEMPPGKKKLTPSEMALLRRWIEQGAVTARPEPEQVQPEFTDEERGFWAFQPVRRAVPPSPQHSDRVRTPVDLFLLAALEKQGLEFAPEADRHTLLRRLCFDLTGLPPTLDRLLAFERDTRPDAYERLVEELLASPRYGERWGRHWLDAAGYADSDGYSPKDLERKYAWKYRDYVVNSFNADLPWNQFLLEQLAGDELLTPPYRNLTPEQQRQLIATGFLRMAPDGTGDGEQEAKTARNEAIAETIKVVSTAVLGLTVGCAQCHDHRYDPILQTDYYRMRAIFEPAFHPEKWRTPAGRLVSLWHDEQFAKAAEIDKQKQALGEERTKILDGIVAEVFERELLKLPEDKRALAREAKGTAADKRTPEQAQLLKEFPPLNVDRGSVYLYEQKRIADHNAKYDKQTADLQAQRPAEDFAHCLTEIPGEVPATRLLARGDVNAPKEVIAPGELSVLCGPGVPAIAEKAEGGATSGRRLAWARHLTRGDHPLVARVIVNRAWQHHFGSGLVTTAGDFGRLGALPTHPELLDWLAAELVDSGWSLKAIQRRIVLSAAYRQSSARRPAHDAIDPDNRLLGRAPVRRVEAEVLRDTLLAHAGRLSSRLGGPPVPVAPDDVGQIVVAVDTRDSAGRPTGKTVALGEDEFRRSLYVQVRRSTPLSMLEAFDAPDLKPNCTQRASSNVSPQALLLMNNPFLLEQAEQLARRLQGAAPSDPGAQVGLAWLLICGKVASPETLRAGTEFLAAQAAEFPQPAADAKAPAGPSPELQALASYCQALLCSNHVLYVD